MAHQKNGRVNILEWFKNSGFEFKYTRARNKLCIRQWSHKHIRMV